MRSWPQKIFGHLFIIRKAPDGLEYLHRRALSPRYGRALLRLGGDFLGGLLHRHLCARDAAPNDGYESSRQEARHKRQLTLFGGAVDWQILVDQQINPSFAWQRLDGRPVRRIEATCEELRASTCRICRILSTIKDLTTEGEQSPYASELQMQTSPWKSQDEFAVLGICQLPHKIEERTNRPFDSFRRNGSQGNFFALFGPDQEVGPRKTPTLIQNFGWMRAAIDECCEHHGIRCNLIPTSFVPRLRVIDCFNSASTISVILAPKPCQYIALSYVWGSKPNNEHNVPIVIRDAIEVTRA